jgi:hypothetical protein
MECLGRGNRCVSDKKKCRNFLMKQKETNHFGVSRTVEADISKFLKVEGILNNRVMVGEALNFK